MSFKTMSLLVIIDTQMTYSSRKEISATVTTSRSSKLNILRQNESLWRTRPYAIICQTNHLTVYTPLDYNCKTRRWQTKKKQASIHHPSILYFMLVERSKTCNNDSHGKIDPISRCVGHLVKFWTVKCSLDAAKRGFYRAFNSIFGKIGHIASQDLRKWFSNWCPQNVYRSYYTALRCSWLDNHTLDLWISW